MVEGAFIPDASLEAAHRELAQVAAYRRPFASPWDFVVRAHRPIGLWVGVVILFVHGVVIPIAALFGRLVVGFNAMELLGICGLVGLGWHQRTKEKREGLTS